jgi:hypothetical protein
LLLELAVEVVDMLLEVVEQEDIKLDLLLYHLDQMPLLLVLVGKVVRQVELPEVLELHHHSTP